LTSTASNSAAPAAPAAHAPATPLPSQRTLILLVGALSAFGPLSIDMYLPGLPELRADFGVGASQTQLTLSACLLGLASGQLLAGPMSDAFGRRRPLMLGVGLYAVASLLCAVAPTIQALIAFRFVQGFAGAAGIVIARSVVRDLYSGVAAARFFSLLLLVSGLAPILAPLLGGQLLRVVSWRGVFVALALIGAALVAATATFLRETHPPEHRQSAGARSILRTFRLLAADRSFVGYALSGGLASAALFSYISGSPFVLQEIYGVSQQSFSFIFAAIAAGYVTCGQINGRLVGRVAPKTLLRIGLCGMASGGGAFLLMVAIGGSGGVGLAGIIPTLVVLVASLGFILPNSTALALADHPRTAGSASALIGLLQYAVGATAAPQVGIAGEETALPMAIVVATAATSALLVFLLFTRPRPS
jgi:DHA1 family bicyclomycin/chloramphenicol resistance-like MFS transporter